MAHILRELEETLRTDLEGVQSASATRAANAPTTSAYAPTNSAYVGGTQSRHEDKQTPSAPGIGLGLLVMMGVTAAGLHLGRMRV